MVKVQEGNGKKGTELAPLTLVTKIDHILLVFEFSLTISVVTVASSTRMILFDLGYNLPYNEQRLLMII